MSNALDRVLYTGKTHTRGGRDGHARSDDGQLDIVLSPPGSPRPGTNPEQLFAAGWSACFLGAMGIAARALQVTLPADAAVDAEVDLGQNAAGYQLQARLRVHLPGLSPATAQAIIEQAHRACPYSKATRGNIDAQIELG